jgi:hypothetical protein
MGLADPSLYPAPGESGFRAIIRGSFLPYPDPIMEAEQLNAIANRLADIAQRSGELRRYL